MVEAGQEMCVGSWEGEMKPQTALRLIWAGLFGWFSLPPLPPLPQLCPLTLSLVGIGWKTPENPLEWSALPSAHDHRQFRERNAVCGLGNKRHFFSK